MLRFPHSALSLAALVALVSGCATTSTPPPPAGSRGPRASEHLEAAHAHDEAAREQTTYPELRGDGTGRVESAPSGMQWYRSWDPSVDHERMAAIHRSKAAEIQAEYEEACGQRSEAEVSMSPIQKFGIGGENRPDGVTIYLEATAGPPDKLLADMRCHRAWMMLSPAGMETCPLDLAGIHLDAHGDEHGITVTITIADKKLVDELQRRTAHDLEARHTK